MEGIQVHVNELIAVKKEGKKERVSAYVIALQKKRKKKKVHMS
jgi:hypothetical protein